MEPPTPPIDETPDSTLDLACPFCQERVTVSASEAGSTSDCPKCGGKFQIPMPVAQNTGGIGQPYGVPRDPEVQEFINKKIAAGICGILVGGLGVHKFILGFNTAGTIMLVVWLVGFITGMCVVIPLLATAAMGIIGLVEGIIYLAKSDEEFYQLYAVQKKEWF